MRKGASPLTRGKLSIAATKTAPMGRIPAHAGKTTSARQVSPSPRAHPRSRGENTSSVMLISMILGASPLTRGKLSWPTPRMVSPGRIPAHAGKTWREALGPPSPGAHPRSRGENLARGSRASKPRGASPLTRGKRYPASTQRPLYGRIPAHAGKTSGWFSLRSVRRAHPRSRGENKIVKRVLVDWTGASPLTRGKLLVAVVREALRGRIPAHAGKTMRHR